MAAFLPKVVRDYRMVEAIHSVYRLISIFMFDILNFNREMTGTQGAAWHVCTAGPSPGAAGLAFKVNCTA
jgi:hypothetical protein